MSDPDKALATQLANIEKRTGKTLAEFTQVIRESGLEKHGEIRDMLRSQFDLGYGDAHTLVFLARQPASTPSGDEAVDGLYSGAKATLRPVHDALMAAIGEFGDFEIAPKKTCVSLRRRKQFAMIGPATKTQVEVGINTKATLTSPRLKTSKPNSMCNYTCRLTEAGEADAELLGWIRRAYDEAG
jgi:hypothetical protein